MEASRIRLLLGATHDLLSSPQNLSQWLGEDTACPLCSDIFILYNTLPGCKFSVSQERYTWRHNQVPKCLAAVIEDRRKEVNSEVIAKVIKQVDFLREGEKTRSACPRHIFWQLSAWEIKQKLVVPAHIVTTQLCPDVVLLSNLGKVVYFKELMVPWEGWVKGAYDIKKRKILKSCWKKLQSEAGVLE